MRQFSSNARMAGAMKRYPALRAELVFILASMSAFAPLSIDMYLPAFTALESHFQTSPGKIQLSLSSFFAAFALGQLLFGPLTDRFGRKPPLYAGLALFTLSSLACAFSPDVHSLIALRFLEGLGACAGGVVSMAVARDVFEGKEAAKTFSLLAMAGAVAPMLAPSVGGLLLGLAGWRGIFLALTGLGALCLLGVALRLPETSPEEKAPASPGEIAKSYWRILSDSRFSLFAAGMGFGGAGMFAYIAGSPFVFMGEFGVTPLQYGLIFGANACGLAASAQLNAMLMRKFEPEAVMKFGAAAQGVFGIALLATSFLRLGGLFGVLLPLFLYIFMMGLLMPNGMTLAMAPFKDRAGTAAALLGSLQFVAASLAALAIGATSSKSPVAMAATIAFCGTAGALLVAKATRKKSESHL